MRVVYYVHGWPPGRVHNGVVAAVGALAPAMRELGHRVDIIAATNGDISGTSDADHVSYLDDVAPARREAAPIRLVSDWIAPDRHVIDLPARRIAAGLARDADILEMEESFGWSAVVARRVGAAVVTRLHGPWFVNSGALKGADALRSQDEKRIRLEGRAIATSAGVTAPSKYILERTKDHYAIALKDAAVIPNAVEPPRADDIWRPDRADPNEMLFVGRFDRLKGADTILRAFAAAAAQRPRLKLTFVGPHHGEIALGGGSMTRDAFLAAEIAPEIAARIAFTGPLSPEAIAPLRRRAFATLIGSVNETFSIALVEALATGSPVICTEVGGMPEIARHGEEALFVPSGDAPAMAAAIATLFDAPALAESLGRRGRERALSRYTPRIVAAACADYYAEMVSRRARKAS